MARAPSVSDEEIFKAATKVMTLRGVKAFTLTEVAAEAGLSRAAIILRFKSARELKIAIRSRMIETFTHALDSLPKTPSGENLLAVTAFIGRYAGSRQGAASFFSSYGADAEDRELLSLEERRVAALRNAIALVMPETAIDHDSAVNEYLAHIAGNLIIWIGSESPDAAEFLLQRTKTWLRLAAVAFDARTPGDSEPLADRAAG